MISTGYLKKKKCQHRKEQTFDDWSITFSSRGVNGKKRRLREGMRQVKNKKVILKVEKTPKLPEKKRIRFFVILENLFLALLGEIIFLVGIVYLCFKFMNGA